MTAILLSSVVHGCGAGSGAPIVTNSAPAVLSVADVSVTEGDGETTEIELSLVVQNPPAADYRVSYASVAGTALEGLDYRSLSGELLLAGSATGATLRVELVGDLLDETDERFTIRFDAPGLDLVRPIEVEIVIEDDDPAPLASIDDVTVGEADGNATFNIGLSGPSALPVSVDYITAGDTAGAGDFVAAEATLNFDPGETDKRVDIAISNDTIVEPTEFFTLSLLNPVNLALGDAVAVAAILDDDGGDAKHGSDSRRSNVACAAPGRLGSDGELVIRTVFAKLPPFSRPVALLQRPADNTEWYVAEQGGRIYRFGNRVGAGTTQLVADLSGRLDSGGDESGLLGMAFHPEFFANGFVYLSYTRAGLDRSNPLISVISRFLSTDAGLTIDVDSEQILLTLEQPFGGNDGGRIGFGADGFLYVAFGAGGGDTPAIRAQNTRNVHGSILRIDVENGSSNAIPVDYPVAYAPRCDTVLLDGDKPNGCRKIDAVCSDLATGCNTALLADPTPEYSRLSVASATGGFVYRGTGIPALYGRYVFGDTVSGAACP